MALSSVIDKIGNRKVPVFQHQSFLYYYTEALISFLLTGIIEYAIFGFKVSQSMQPYPVYTVPVVSSD